MNLGSLTLDAWATFVFVFFGAYVVSNVVLAVISLVTTAREVRARRPSDLDRAGNSPLTPVVSIESVRVKATIAPLVAAYATWFGAPPPPCTDEMLRIAPPPCSSMKRAARWAQKK